MYTFGVCACRTALKALILDYNRLVEVEFDINGQLMLRSSEPWINLHHETSLQITTVLFFLGGGAFFFNESQRNASTWTVLYIPHLFFCILPSHNCGKVNSLLTGNFIMDTVTIGLSNMIRGFRLSGLLDRAKSFFTTNICLQGLLFLYVHAAESWDIKLFCFVNYVYYHILEPFGFMQCGASDFWIFESPTQSAMETRQTGGDTSSSISWQLNGHMLTSLTGHKGWHQMCVCVCVWR